MQFELQVSPVFESRAELLLARAECGTEREDARADGNIRGERVVFQFVVNGLL